jgi:hypothetical protein
MAQHRVNVLGDGSAVPRSGEAMAAEIRRDDVVRRRAALLDPIEQPDRRFDAGAGGQGSRQLSVISCQSN